MRAAQVELGRDRVLGIRGDLDRGPGRRRARDRLPAFGTNAGLFKRLYDVTVAGDQDEVPFACRESWQRMPAADPPALVAMFARGSPSRWS